MTIKMHNKKNIRKIMTVTVFLVSILFALLLYKNLVTKKDTYTTKPIAIENWYKKISSPRIIPEMCRSWSEKCWSESVKNGTVKFIRSGAKDNTGRQIIFAYFINSETAFGVKGLYNYLPIYKDTGELAGGDISGGDATPIDWVYGTKTGIVVHDKINNTCYERSYSLNGNSWQNAKIACP